MWPCQHIRIGHTRHWHVRERFSATIASGCNTHQARIEFVLHVTAQDTVLDQHVVLAGRALVVYGQRSTTIRHRSIIHDRAFFRRHAFTHAPRERRRALAIKVALKSVTDRLVQQDAGPAGPKNHGHGAGRCCNRLHLHGCLTNGFARVVHRLVAGQKVVEIGTRSAAGISLLATTVLHENDADVQTNKRSDIGRQSAVRRRDQHEVVTTRQADDDLLNTLVETARCLLEFGKHGRLLLIGDARRGIGNRVQRRRFNPLPGLQRFRLS